MIRLAHVCIESADLDATERFYACLGLSRQFDFRNLQGEPIGYYLRFGNDSFLEVVRVAEAKPEGRVMHFAIETDDIDGLRERLVAGGYMPGEKNARGGSDMGRQMQRPGRHPYRTAGISRTQHAASRWHLPDRLYAVKFAIPGEAGNLDRVLS